MNEKPIECPLCRIGKYPHFGYSGSGACDHCGAVWTYDEGDTLTEDSLRRLWEKVPRWIPVEERLPSEHACVLAYHSNAARIIAWHDGNGWQTDADTGGRGDVTHWMSLPPELPDVK